MIRQIIVASSACVLLIAPPMVASAQEPISPPREWREGLSELTSALAGTFGDEASDIEQALAKISRALSAWDGAIRALEARMSATPDAPLDAAVQMRISAAVTYAHRGRLADALRHVDEAARLAPRRADVHVLRGLWLERSLLTGEAAEAFQRAWSVDRTDPISAYHVVRSAATLPAVAPREGGDVGPPTAALEAAYVQLLAARSKATPPVTLQPAGDSLVDTVLPPAAYTQAYAHMARGEYAEAIVAFRAAAAIDPLVTDPALRSDGMRQAAGALRQGRVGEARALIESAGPLQDSAEVHRVLGLVEWADRRYDKSVEHLEVAARINPRDERPRLALARVLSDAGRDADAVRVLEQTVHAFPESPLAHWSLGSQYERLNRLTDARREYEMAAGHAPAQRDRLDAAIGRLAAGAADVAGARAAFGRAVAANLNDPTIHKAMAGVLLQQDRSSDALVELVAAVLLDPADAGAHAGVGQIYLNAGRYADAVGPLRRALELSPADTAARYGLATSLMRLGRAQEAAREFERVEEEQRQSVADRRRAIDVDVRREESAGRGADGSPGR